MATIQKSLRPTRDQIALLRAAEEGALYGDPLDLRDYDRHLVEQCEAAGWLRIEDDEIYLTTEGHEIASMEGR